ncbi:hypothetical protein DBR12_06730 [Acidovorax sp. HMWF029]|nr:hypothetical protein DBR12_06730 [Acidovorax sp. HMWF029]
MGVVENLFKVFSGIALECHRDEVNASDAQHGLMSMQATGAACSPDFTPTRRARDLCDPKKILNRF